MKLSNKLYTVILSIVLLAGCEQGLVYDEGIPAEIYENVGLASPYCRVSARELFKNQIYAKGNWNKWVEGYISTVEIGTGTGSVNFTNTTTESVVINDTVTVTAGESKTFNSFMKVQYLASAPGDSLYVINVFVPSACKYASPNNDYYFDSERFTPPYKIVTPAEDPSARIDDGGLLGTRIILPVKPREAVVTLVLSQVVNCVVRPVDGAPALGIPGDFTQPRRYMVINESRRPDKKEAKKRLYEIRVTFLPSPIVP